MTPADVTGSLERAADEWIAARLAHFDPFVWASREERYLRRKAFAELAIYCLVRQKFDGGHGGTIGAFVIDRVAEPGFADLIQRGPRQFLLYSAAVLYAHAQGRLTAELRVAVETVLNGRTVWSCERPPHRMLDLWHFLNGYGDPRAHRLDRDATVAASCLTFPPDPVDCTLSEAYALTHNLLFLHNFGCGGSGYLGRPGGFAVDDVMQTQIVRWLAEPNFDIVFELVMTGLLENAVDPRLAQHAVGRLLQSFDSRGFIAGPRPPASETLPVPAVVPDGAGPFMDWALHYHTNLVVASALRIMRRTVPPHLVPIDSGAVDQLAQALTDLARYELVAGAAALVDLDTNDPLLGRIIALARDYLARQRRGSGLYGYYLDEAKIHAGASRSDVPAQRQFEAELQRPLSQELDALLGR